MSPPGLLRGLMPPLLLHLARRAAGRATVFHGPYATWELAAAQASGYDAAEVLRRVAGATRQVLAGAAAYERDGVLFDRIEYAFPVMTALLLAACADRRDLVVLDIGGSLGSSYRECRALLSPAADRVRWLVVEQDAFVAYGRSELQSEELLFFPAVADAVAHARPSVVLLSSVLQYLPRPSAALAEAMASGPPYIVIDRTIVNDGEDDVAYVQHVPRSIYEASYPVWSLARSRLQAQLAAGYDLVSAHGSLAFPDLAAIDSSFEGFLYARREPA
jgi:putative methyltransferase (TIGR04325 family)